MSAAVGHVDQYPIAAEFCTQLVAVAAGAEYAARRDSGGDHDCLMGVTLPLRRPYAAGRCGGPGWPGKTGPKFAKCRAQVWTL